MHPYSQKKPIDKLFFAIPFQISRATVVAGLVLVVQTGMFGPLGSLSANFIFRVCRAGRLFNGMGSFLFFAYGLGNGVYFPFAVGATTILISHPPKPELIYQDLLKYRPTLFFTVPTLMGALADYKESCAAEGRSLAPVESLRACISSAEILSPERKSSRQALSPTFFNR